MRGDPVVPIFALGYESLEHLWIAIFDRRGHQFNQFRLNIIGELFASEALA